MIPTRISGPEAVTLRGSFTLAILASILALSGSAAATAPLPTFEHRVEVPDRAIDWWESGVYFKEDFGPYCVRDIFCVGPFEWWEEYHFGQTGMRVETEDVYVVAGHDPARKERYGPYGAPTLVSDDLRVCWEGCNLPDSVYADAHANVTLTLYVLGSSSTFHQEIGHEVDSLHPDAVPRTYCRFMQHTPC